METRERILREAFKLFLKKGYRNVTLNEISAEAGVTKGGFYHYFKSKDELYIEIINNYIFTLFEKFKGRITSGKGVRDTVYRLFSFCREFFLEMNAFAEETGLYGYFNFFFQEMERFGPLFERFSKKYEESIHLIANILERGKKSGEVRKDVDARASAFEIIALIEGTVFLWVINRKLGDEKVIEKISDNYWRSISQ